jgi:hypothetical protein
VPDIGVDDLTADPFEAPAILFEMTAASDGSDRHVRLSPLS